MATETVRVEGLAALQRAFRKIDKDLARGIREELRKVAEPVRVEASRLFQPISASSAAGYRVSVRQRGVAVEQSRKRTTGLRPDYGRHQMRRALGPALAANEENVVVGLDRMLGRLGGEAGF